MKSRVVKGATVSLVGQGINQALRFISNLVLSRLLFPEAFGLMGLILTLLVGLEMLSDIGIRTSIIQHKRGEERRFLNTAWTLQLLRGVFLWVIGALAAIPAVIVYNDKPELGSLIPVATLVALILGAYSSKFSLLYRNMQLTRVVSIELTGQVIALVVKIGHALIFRSVWSLVVGHLVDVAVRMILTHIFIPGASDRLAWERETVRDLLSFGKWVFVSTTITFFAMRFDMIALGKLISSARLGVYQISLNLSTVPLALSSQVIASVILPALSEAQRENHEALVISFKKARQIVMPLGIFMILGVALFSPTFFYFLYDERYGEAGWMAQLSMLTVWFNYLENISGRALLAIGDAKPLAQTNALKLITTVVASLLGFHFADIFGFLIGMAIGAFVAYLYVLNALWRKHRLPAGLSDFRFGGLGIGLGLGGILGASYLADLLRLDQEGRVLSSVAFAVVILTPLGLWAAMAVIKKIYSDDVLAKTVADRLYELRSISVPLGVMGVLSAALLAPPLVRMLRGELHPQTGWMIQMALLVIWLNYLELISGRAAVMMLEAKSLVITNVVKAVLSVGAVGAGFYFGGFIGMIIGVGVGGVLGYLYVLLAVHFKGILGAQGRFDLIPLLPAVGVAIIGVYLPGWLLERFSITYTIALKRRVIDEQALVSTASGLALLAVVVIYGAFSIRAALRARA